MELRSTLVKTQDQKKEKKMTARRFIFTSTILLAILVLVCGCSSTKSTTQPKETQAPAVASAEPVEETKEPVILRVGGMQDVDCWNPFSCTAIYMWGDLLVEGLTIQGKASKGCDGEPAMAESWELSEDGYTWTIKLHKGITFPDGTPVTAHTVKEFYDWWASIEYIS